MNERRVRNKPSEWTILVPIVLTFRMLLKCALTRLGWQARRGECLVMMAAFSSALTRIRKKTFMTSRNGLIVGRCNWARLMLPLARTCNYS